MSSVPGRDFAIEVYRVNGTAVAVRVSHDGQTGLITQAEMADLYGVDVSGVSRHIQAIFDEGELAKEGNLQKMQIGPGTKPTTLPFAGCGGRGFESRHRQRVPRT